MTTARDDLAKGRVEAAALLHLDPTNLSPADALRCSIVTSLRLVVDAAQADVLQGNSTDLGKLLVAVENLIKMLPAARPEEARRVTRESAQQRLLETVLKVIAAEDVESSAAASEMEAMAAAMEQDPKALPSPHAERTITLHASDIIEPGRFHVGGPPPGPDDPPKPGTTIIDVKPAAPTRPSAPQYELVPEDRSWMDYVNADGSIRSTPRGRWSPT